MTAFDEQVFAEITPLVEAGFAIHWLHPKSKRPIGEDWSTKPIATLEQLKRRHVSGNNVGIRTGHQLVDGSYAYLIDLDIRDPAYAEEAHAKLNELLPGIADSVPSVISGSGGPSRHYWFVSDKPFPSKKLARSEGFEMVHDEKLGRDVKKRHWEVELFGLNKQAVIPPSIHPDTGKPYLWERRPDLDLVALGLFPRISSSQLEQLGMQDSASQAESLDLKPPLGLTEDEAEDILDTLLSHAPEEYCEDRDGWLQVGMALHHEFGGDEVGWELWKRFSENSDKYDEKEQRIVWNSFRPKPNSVRMASLKAVANQVRMLTAFDDLDDDEEEIDVNDLIGGGDDSLDDDIAALIGESSSSGDDFESVLSAGASEGLSWISLMDVKTDTPGFSATLNNAKLVVRHDPRISGIAELNLFTGRIVQRKNTGHKDPRRKTQPKPVLQLDDPAIWGVRDPINGDNWSDRRMMSLRDVIEASGTQGGYGFKVTDRDLKAAVNLAATRNCFHPVQEYLESLVWDGKPRVENMFVEYLGATPNAYTHSISRLMMLAAVARIYEPGHKFDFAVILEGLQGKRKSTFVRILGKNWWGELDGDFADGKGMIEVMQSKWILELPELSGFARAEVRSLKAFISRQVDCARMAYAEFATDFPRQCIFIGTTNDREYLKDDTGGRRFWPVYCHVGEINTERLASEVDQLWAETLVAYRQMRADQPYGDLPLYLTDPEAQKIAQGLQEARRVESADDAWANEFDEWLDKPVNDGGINDDDFRINAPPRYRERVTAMELWTQCLAGDKKHYTAANQQQIGRAMAKLAPKWVKKGQKRVDGKPFNTYVRTTPTPGSDDNLEGVIG